MIIVPRRGTRVADVGCPLAVIDTPSTPGNTVSADHWGGGRQIAEHLAALGHRKLLLIGTDSASNVQNDRIGGIKSGLSVDMTSQTLWTERIEAQKGAGCSLGLVARAAEGFTAFAAISDLHALRALTELQRGGISVPEQVSVTGFDDLVWSSVVTPTLTTVRMDMARIAEIAIAALVEAIEVEKTDGRSASPAGHSATVKAAVRSVPMELIVRQSSGRAPTSSRNLKQGALAQ
jgi:LacI family transcriptional regulator